MKGSFSASPSFHPLNIKNAQIFNSQPLLLCDNKRMYVGQNGVSIPWQSKPIINCTYSKIHDLLFVLCQDWKLCVFTINLELLTKFTWDSKYTVCFKLIEQLKAFLMIGVTQIQLLKVQIISNVKQTKFLSSMKCQLIKANNTISAKDKLKWNKGYEIITQEKLLYVWSLQDLYFYKLDTLQVIVKMENITKKQVPLTKVFYNRCYKYVVIGYLNGQIKIWKVPHKNTDIGARDLIHTFDYHTKSILNILKSKDKRIFISHSADQKICFWNLDTFEMVYNYDFSGLYQNISIINDQYFYATKDEGMGRCQFGKRLQYICNINNEVVYSNKSYEAINLFQQQSNIKQIQFTLNSNLGFNIHMNNLIKKDVNKSNIQFFYPPLKSKGIHQIIHCPFQNNKYYLLVETGEIYKARIQNNSSKIQNLYVIQKIIDDQSHQLNQQANIIKFLKIVPPKYDSQIIAKNYNASKHLYTKQSRQALQIQYQNKQLIAIGCKKGAIIFLQRNNFQKIYTRISYHRSQILLLDSIYNKQLNQMFLLSLCEQQYFKIVKFQQGKSNCLHTISCFKSIVNIKSSYDKLFCIFQKGMFQIFRINSIGVLKYIQNQDANDHEQNIICLDVDQRQKIVMTAGQDQKIKIWTFQKILIYQISLNQKINHVVLCNQLDIIIAHNKKISLLRKDNFSINQLDFQIWTKQFNSIKHQQYQLSNLINSFKKKKNQQLLSKNKRRNSLAKSFNKNKFFQQQDKIQQIIIQKQNPLKSFMSTNKNTKKMYLTNQKFRRNSLRQKSKVSQSESVIPNADYQIVNKHLKQMSDLRRTTLQCFPKIRYQKQSLFDQFMKAKLLNKKILTRRDITLNRIIMKNIIKQYIGGDIVEGLSGVKVDT